jgi:hypothetical protein
MPKNSSGPRNAPPVYRPQPAPKVLQRKSALTNQPAPNWSSERITGVAKMSAARSNPAPASTPRLGPTAQPWAPAVFPRSLSTIQARKKKKKTPTVSKGQKTWENLCCYSKDKAKQVLKHYPNTYLAIMDAFVQYYSNGIRGHCSGGSGDKANSATLEDLSIFNGWYKRLREAI